MHCCLVYSFLLPVTYCFVRLFIFFSQYQKQILGTLQILAHRGPIIVSTSGQRILKMMSTPVHIRELCLRFELLYL
jgi:hypothetical protein